MQNNNKILQEINDAQRVSISAGNRKTGALPSISFPPVITCANCAECKKKCYALKTARLYKATGEAWARNLEIWKSNPQAVKRAIIGSAITAKYFRYFIGGDIPDASFLLAMVDVAKKCRGTRFLAFTKKFDLINDYLASGKKLPNNLKIIFSGWGKLTPENPHNLPESNVIFKGEEAPDGALICGGNCTACICQGVGCWQLKKGQKIYFYEH